MAVGHASCHTHRRRGARFAPPAPRSTAGALPEGWTRGWKVRGPRAPKPRLRSAPLGTPPRGSQPGPASYNRCLQHHRRLLWCCWQISYSRSGFPGALCLALGTARRTRKATPRPPCRQTCCRPALPWLKQEWPHGRSGRAGPFPRGAQAETQRPRRARERAKSTPQAPRLWRRLRGNARRGCARRGLHEHQEEQCQRHLRNCHPRHLAPGFASTRRRPRRTRRNAHLRQPSLSCEEPRGGCSCTHRRRR
mmetsp:Transcript_31196/g.85544  ORF Transcript_31196/g.85544 Transcript_31196/m.85544 type:complete len:250 (+) Transcript_31196:231-980(+)